MNGAVIPHTPIAVDNWFVRTCQNCRLFFLSHAHTDHTVALTSSWKTHKIYCSDITKKIVMHKLGVQEELLVALSLDEPVLLPMDETGNEMLTVTLIDANHCPGAVMFLFEGYFGRVLYTGDFRFDKSMLSHDALQGGEIDKLFLDNTYSNAVCTFPSRKAATNKVLEIVGSHLDHDIVIGLRTLGKEELLVTVAVSFNTWIGVTPLRMALLKQLGLPDVFTCEMDKTRIRVVNANEITKVAMRNWNTERPTIAILPTALFEGGHNPYQYMPDVFVVPFSDHSSFSELKSFVSGIQPKEIVPLVLKHRSGKGLTDESRNNMSAFSEFLNKEPLSATTIPESVMRYMGNSFYNGTRKKRSRSFKVSRPKRLKCTGVVFDDDDMTVDSGNSLHNDTDSCGNGQPDSIPGRHIKTKSQLVFAGEERESRIIQECCITSTDITEPGSIIEEGHSSVSCHSKEPDINTNDDKDTRKQDDIQLDASTIEKSLMEFISQYKYNPDFDWFLCGSDSDDSDNELGETLAYMRDLNNSCPSPEYLA